VHHRSAFYRQPKAAILTSKGWLQNSTWNGEIYPQRLKPNSFNQRLTA